MNNALAYVRQPEARSSYLPLGANKDANVVLKSGREISHGAGVLFQRGKASFETNVDEHKY